MGSTLTLKTPLGFKRQVSQQGQLACSHTFGYLPTVTKSSSKALNVLHSNCVPKYGTMALIPTRQKIKLPDTRGVDFIT